LEQAQLIDDFGWMCGQMLDTRQSGHNERYRIADFMKSRLRRIFLSAPLNAGLPADDTGETGVKQSGDGVWCQRLVLGHVDTGADGQDTA
jgi:hypothetical protein